MTQDEKIAEEIAVKHTEVLSEDEVVLKTCRWLLSKDIAEAMKVIERYRK